MPSASNFSLPDDSSDPTNTKGTGDQGQVWNPSGGPDGKGAWEAPPPAGPVRNTVDSAFGAVWGNRNPDTINGVQQPGTSGVDFDTARYRGLAGQSVAAPTIDQTQSSESRGIGTGALGLLAARANGEVTPAQEMQAAQTTGAVNAVQSGAASIRGGAGARAAAARGAVMQGAQVRAQGNQDQAALAARERADAADQYFGAASAQRGRDLGLATSNAGLAVGQRGANLNNSLFYEGLRFNTKNAQQQAGLGLSLSDQAAANQARTQQQQQNAVAWGRGVDTAGTGAAGASGAVSAYNSTDQGDDKGSGGDDPWSSDNYSGSDVRSKTAVTPISDREAARLSQAGDTVLAGQRAALDAGPSVGKPAYDGKYLPSPFFGAKQQPAASPSLLDAIGARVARDNAAEPRYGYFDEADAGSKARLGGNPGYAASRAGQPGGMFGAASQSVARDYGDKARAVRNREVAMSDPAAKTQAYMLGHGHGSAGAPPQFYGQAPTAPAGAPSAPPTLTPPLQPDRATASQTTVTPFGEQPQAGSFMLSDARAKQEAYDLGVARGMSASPENRGGGMTGTRAPRLESPGGKAPNADFSRKDPSEQRAGVAYRDELAKGAYGEMAKGGALMPLSPALGATHLASAAQLANEAKAPAPAAAEEPGYFGQIADRAKAALTYSDPKTKTKVDDSPMAAANRSMAPSIYEYKAEFTPPEQKPGEKNVGPMANKMKANPIAATAIVLNPETGLLAIDKTKGLKLVMGGLADLQRQVDSMKGRRA